MTELRSVVTTLVWFADAMRSGPAFVAPAVAGGRVVAGAVVSGTTSMFSGFALLGSGSSNVLLRPGTVVGVAPVVATVVGVAPSTGVVVVVESAAGAPVVVVDSAAGAAVVVVESFGLLAPTGVMSTIAILIAAETNANFLKLFMLISHILSKRSR
jgi:hypothetical protein